MLVSDDSRTAMPPFPVDNCVRIGPREFPLAEVCNIQAPDRTAIAWALALTGAAALICFGKFKK